MQMPGLLKRIRFRKKRAAVSAKTFAGMTDRQIIAANRHDCGWIKLYYGNISTLAQLIGAKKIAEVGVAYGYHAQQILAALPEVSYFGVDPYLPDYDPQDAFVADVRRLFSEPDGVRAMNRLHRVVTEELAQFGPRARLIRKRSDDGAEEFADGSLDLVFIDGDHRYQAVVSDLRHWWPKVRSGGLLVGDDYSWEGVARAVDEFCAAENLQLMFIEKAHTRTKTYFIVK